MGRAVEDGGNCSGGITIGDLERLRWSPERERLRDRPRIREVMAPKNDSSVGEAAPRPPRE